MGRKVTLFVQSALCNVHIFVRFGGGAQTTAITVEENIKNSCILGMLRIQLNYLHQEI